MSTIVTVQNNKTKDKFRCVLLSHPTGVKNMLVARLAVAGTKFNGLYNFWLFAKDGWEICDDA
jgi:hypothetical protein